MAEEPPYGKFNISFGNLTQSQVVMGDYNTVTQKVGLTPQEAAELQSLFTNLRSTVTQQAPPAQCDEALTQAEELEAAVVAQQPDLGRIRKVLGWFRDNAPQVAGAVLSVVVSPLVGKVVEGAGDAVADRFRQIVKDEL